MQRREKKPRLNKFLPYEKEKLSFLPSVFTFPKLVSLAKQRIVTSRKFCQGGKPGRLPNFQGFAFFNSILEPKTNTPGLELNKSTPFWIKTNILSDGPKMGSLDLKDPTIAVSVPIKSTVEMLQKLITGKLLPTYVDPNQNLKIVLAITLKICISDTMLVNLKCVWEEKVYFQKL